MRMRITIYIILISIMFLVAYALKNALYNNELDKTDITILDQWENLKRNDITPKQKAFKKNNIIQEKWQEPEKNDTTLEEEEELRKITGKWKIIEECFYPRYGMNIYQPENLRPFIGRKLIIDNDLKIIFDNEAYFCIGVENVDVKYLMDYYQIPLGLAYDLCGEDSEKPSIGKTIKHFIFEDGKKRFRLLLKGDGTLFMKLGENYYTDAFYLMSKSK